MVILIFLNQNCCKLNTKYMYLCHTQNAYRTLRGRDQVNFQRENQPKSEF